MMSNATFFKLVAFWYLYSMFFNFLATLLRKRDKIIFWNKKVYLGFFINLIEQKNAQTYKTENWKMQTKVKEILIGGKRLNSYFLPIFQCFQLFSLDFRKIWKNLLTCIYSRKIAVPYFFFFLKMLISTCHSYLTSNYCKFLNKVGNTDSFGAKRIFDLSYCV